MLAVAVFRCGGGESSSASAIPEPIADAPIDLGGTPVAVAVGAGRVWVADNSGSRVIELDSMDGNPIGKSIPVAAGPQAIAVGEDGVWVASGDGTVTRIDPGTRNARPAPIKIADTGGIAVGEGAVWVTSRARDTVTRLDPSSLRPVGDPIPVGLRTDTSKK